MRVGHSGRGAAFTSIDIRVGQGQALAAEFGIRATPTFLFFLDGKKVSGRRFGASDLCTDDDGV